MVINGNSFANFVCTTMVRKLNFQVQRKPYPYMLMGGRDQEHLLVKNQRLVLIFQILDGAYLVRSHPYDGHTYHLRATLATCAIGNTASKIIPILLLMVSAGWL